MHILGKIKDIKKYGKGIYFNPPHYSWSENCVWLDSASEFLLLSDEISGVYKLELDYLIGKGKTNFHYINEKVKIAIESYMGL